MWFPIIKSPVKAAETCQAEESNEDETHEHNDGDEEPKIVSIEDSIAGTGEADVRPDPPMIAQIMPQASIPWQNGELRILKELPLSLGPDQSYDRYCQKCEEQNFSVRSKIAFLVKLRRMRREDKSTSRGIHNSIVATMSNDSSKESYMHYVEICQSKGIRARSYLVFKKACLGQC